MTTEDESVIFNKRRDPTANEVRAMRLKYDLTVFQAAELVYASASAWQRWENGQRTMRRAYWELFLSKLGEHDCQKSLPLVVRLKLSKGSHP